MEKTIAVYTKADDSLDEFLTCNKIDIYKKEESTWTKVNTIPMDFSKEMEAFSMRKYISEIIEAIDSKIIAGGSLTGLPYQIFNNKGFDIFDICDLQNATFDGVLEDIKQNESIITSKSELPKNTQPVETDICGHYYLDLVSLMKASPDISSKKALMNFIQNKSFEELTLICSHIPPWMENMNLNIKQKKDKNGNIIALISKS